MYHFLDIIYIDSVFIRYLCDDYYLCGWFVGALIAEKRVCDVCVCVFVYVCLRETMDRFCVSVSVCILLKYASSFCDFVFCVIAFL